MDCLRASCAELAVKVNGAIRVQRGSEISELT